MPSVSISDLDKMRLIKIARSQQYNGAIEEFENEQVTVNKAKKQLTINYILVKKKRPIKQSFSYNGEKYKIYGDWETTRVNKKYSTIITEAFINNLINDTTPIIVKCKKEILAQIPLELRTEESLRQEIEVKYLPLYEQIKLKYGKIHKRTKSLFEKKYKEQVKIETSDMQREMMALKTVFEDLHNQFIKLIEQQNNIELTITTIKKAITSIENEVYFIFKKSKEKKRKERIEEEERELAYQMSMMEEVAASLSSLKNAIDENSNKRKELSNIITQKKDEISAKIEEKEEHYKQLFIAKEEKEIANIKKAEEAELKRILQTKEENTTITTPVSMGEPSKEWRDEERAKVNRIFKENLTLREWILKRDNYTCKQCGNSIANEPNLLLEVDHIHPVSKWGPSVPENLQTLCWRCNRAKSNK